MSEQELNEQSEADDTQPSAPPTEDGDVEEQGGSQDHPESGAPNLPPGSVAGTDEEQGLPAEGLEVPGSWRGPDEPGEVEDEGEDYSLPTLDAEE